MTTIGQRSGNVMKNLRRVIRRYKDLETFMKSRQ